MLYAVTDNDVVFRIWKTENAGGNWVNVTTDQFVNGFLSFIHAFSADTVLAVGSQNGGYWEIQQTTDGGDTWKRIPRTSIPTGLTNEYTNWMYHSQQGNKVWFGTSNGRCYRSVDRGLTWKANSPVGGASGEVCDVKFSAAGNGVFFRPGLSTSIRRSYDEGANWAKVTLPGNLSIFSASPVEGFSEGFIFASPTTDPKAYDIYFTPDLFNSVVLLKSNLPTYGFLRFKDAATGWISGAGTTQDNIYRFNGLLNAVEQANSNTQQLSVIPNPGVGKVLVKLPGDPSMTWGTLRIYSISGKLTKEQKVAQSRSWLSLDATEFENGMYVVEFTNERGEKSSLRWIVEH